MKARVAEQLQPAESRNFSGTIAEILRDDKFLLMFYAVALFIIANVQRYVSADAGNDQAGFRFALLLEANAGEVLSLFATYFILYSSNCVGRLQLARHEIFLLLFCALLFIPPQPGRLPFVGAGAMGFVLWRRKPYSAPVASLGQLWCVLSVFEVWGPFVFRIVSAPIVRVESAAVAWLGDQFGLGFSLDGILIRAPSGWSVFVLEACSSFHNISLAVLVWMSLLKLAGRTVDRSNLTAAGVGIVINVILNFFRIMIMAQSENDYRFWHDGVGAVLFSCVTLVAVALPTIFALHSSAEKSNPISRDSDHSSGRLRWRMDPER
jgi:exosortase/archaeosortase family protein